MGVKKLIQLGMFLLAVSAISANAEDMFPRGSPRKIERFSEMPNNTTIGGYPVYTGGRAWRFILNEVTTNNLDVRIGHAQLISPLGQDYFAEMAVAASMGGGSESGYFSADVCGLNTPHLFMQNKASGQNDNCLVMDPYVAKIGRNDFTMLQVKIRNSQSSWRLYDLTLLMSLNKLGFPGTTIADWSREAISHDPKKKAFVDRATAWATQLQDAVNNAMAFSKPQDVFVGVPPIQTLLDAEQPGSLGLN